jgi:ankyrin repeat protein
MESITYSDFIAHTKLNELISSCFEKAYKTWRYHPVIFTDRTNRDLIRQLIETQYKAIDSREHSIVEAITQARQAKHLSIAEYLESQQSINEVNQEGNTLLHIAVKTADVKRVQELSSKGADVDITNKEGQSPIDCAAEYYCLDDKEREVYLEILKCLLDNKAKVKLSTLSAAIKSGNEKALALLLPHSSLNDVLYMSYTNYSDKKELSKPWYVDLMFEAIEREHPIELLTLLKESGADFNRNDGQNWTLLRLAISNLPSFEAIIRRVRDFRESIRGCEDRVGPEALDNVYDDLEKRYRERFDKELGLLNYLLDNGADPRISTKDGITPLYALIKDTDLYYLSNNGYEELLDKLLGKGADVNALTKTQSTPLHAAVIAGDTAAVKYLIKHEAELNNKDNEGNTPLHLAAQLCFPISAKELIQAGADITIINGNKLTPLELLDSSYEKKKIELNQN